jgi:hypothetical protein
MLCEPTTTYGAAERGTVERPPTLRWPTPTTPPTFPVTELFLEKNAAPTLLARHSGLGRDSVGAAERPMNNAGRRGHERRADQRVLGRQGELGGVTHRDKPKRPFDGSRCDKGESLALVAPDRELSEFAEMADKGVGTAPRRYLPRSESHDGHGNAFRLVGWPCLAA